MKLSVMYRGPLTSCNYDCGYCPFAKRHETKAQLHRDKIALEQFFRWLTEQTEHRWKVLFTPWGEALTRKWYRDAVTALTHAPSLDTVAIQTNLSCGLEWIEECQVDRLAFWATFHPTQIDRQAFIGKVRHLHDLGVRISVGMVGVVEYFEEISTLRNELPEEVYLWINAQQPRPRPYTAEETAFLTSIDPMFELTARRHHSLGKTCRTGETVFTVDGTGAMRRCHFVDTIIGNIYQPGWQEALVSRPCPNRFCNCYLGIAQLPSETTETFFGTNLLERIPAGGGSKK